MATYPYRNAAGELLFEVLRYRLPDAAAGRGAPMSARKTFRQRRPDGRGGWLWSVPAALRTLYRLPELLAAPPEEPVFFVEGEKDADALAALGLVATTVPCGTSGWDRAFAPYFAGRHVFLLPDNDTPGRRFMAEVGTSLLLDERPARAAHPIQLLSVGPGGDVSDWLAQGGTKRELLLLAEAACDCGRPPGAGQRVKGGGPGPRPLRPATAPIVSASELEAMSFPPLRAVIPGLIYEGTALLAGAPKLGKSFLMLQLALAVARGEPVLGSGPVEQGDVLYLPLEDGLRRIKRRIRGLLGSETDWPPALSLCAEWPRLGEGGVEQIDDWLAAHPAARLVVIDTFQRVRDAGGRYTSAYAEDYEALRPLSPLAEAHRVAIVVVHHTRKLESDDPLDLVNGTVGLTGVVDTALILRRSRGTADASLLVTGRDTEAELALCHDGATGRWQLAGDGRSAQLSASRAAILAALREAGEPLTPAQLAQRLGQPVGNVTVFLRRLLRSREVRQPGRGWYAAIETPATAPPCQIDQIDQSEQAAEEGQADAGATKLIDRTHLTGGSESSHRLPAAFPAPSSADTAAPAAAATSPAPAAAASPARAASSAAAVAGAVSPTSTAAAPSIAPATPATPAAAAAVVAAAAAAVAPCAAPAVAPVPPAAPAAAPAAGIDAAAPAGVPVPAGDRAPRPVPPLPDGDAPASGELPCALCGGAIDHFTPEGEPRCAQCA